MQVENLPHNSHMLSVPVHSANMLAKVHSYVLMGIDALPCEVEVDVTNQGLKRSIIVGLAQTAVKESMERVEKAILNSGIAYKGRKLLINLAPGDIKKEGPSLDLPIAIGMLRGGGFIEGEKHAKYLIAGELSLDGRVRKIKGALSLALLARQQKKTGVIVPQENVREAAVVEGVDVIGVTTLSQAMGFCNGGLELEPHPIEGEFQHTSLGIHAGDFADVKGQEAVKRALVICAGGAHNLLMLGPPGTGKSMLAKRIPGILPPLTRNESLETSRIYSAMGLLPDDTPLLTARPVRTPHHSATAQALVGGGSIPKPGECSLAHNGVLFLDELPEFNRSVLETLRQPMEDEVVTISRVHASVKFPARFMLVAAMNPSKSGYGNKHGGGDNYISKISGPLMDRIDMHTEVSSVPYSELTAKRAGTDTKTMRDQVLAVRAIQAKRLGDGRYNGKMTSRELNTHCMLSEGCLTLMKQAVSELGLSARAYDKVRRVARTIADLEASVDIAEHHLAEAIGYRLLDRRQ